MERDDSDSTPSAGLGLFRSRRVLIALGVITLLFILPAFVFAQAPAGANAAAIDAQLKQDLAVIAQAKPYFGHHSVGDNLLEGLRGLATEAGTPVKVTETRPGKNGDPKAKIEDWSRAVLALPKGDADVVFMKFCYADFSATTDAAELIGLYKTAIERVKKDRPDLTVMHVTTPIRTPADGWKTKLKRMFGREVWEDAAALRRQEYNDQLRAAFKGEPFFDLAAFEATRPTGEPERFEIAGKQTEALAAAYSADGGHLNELGKKAGAKALARALAETVKLHQAKAPPPAPAQPAAAQ